MAFWLASLVLFLTSNEPKSLGLYVRLLGTTDAKGELLVVGPSLLAPVFLLLFFSWPRAERFQQGTLLSFSVLLSILSSVAYGQQISHTIGDQAFLVLFGRVLFLFAIFLLYVYLIQDRVPDADAAARAGEDELYDKVSRLRDTENG